MFYLTSRLITSVSAFLYPGYASYKTLSQRPASEEDLERWLMYWSVLGCIVSVEYVAEWLVSWIPFYYPIKTIFLLYLALPQTRGSSYLYIYHLQPFFHSHETEIDAALASLKARIYSFVQARFRALWEQITSSLGQQSQQASFNPAGGVTDVGASPTLSDPVSGPTQLFSNLWQSYGPTIVASGAALLRQSQAAAANARANSTRQPLLTPNPTPPATVRSNTAQSIEERRRQLEAELASLPIPPASPSFQPSRTSSEADLRDRSGRFEEVEVPSDAEGYEAGDGELGHAYASDSGSAAPRAGWFGWASGAGKRGGSYERVKND